MIHRAGGNRRPGTVDMAVFTDIGCRNMTDTFASGYRAIVTAETATRDLDMIY